jgi:peptidoglycan DL-endopeptidase CwlO
MAPPAHADEVTWGLSRVKHDKIVLAKADKHMHWATRHHYKVAGIRRWLVGHLATMHRRAHVGLRFNTRVAARLQKWLNHTEYRLKQWRKVRVRLHRKVAHKAATLAETQQWVQGVIAAQAAAQSRLADQTLKALTASAKKGKDPAKAAPKVLSGNSLGVRAVRAAITQLGVPYVWGGETPGKAFDCSGLVKWAYGQVGVSLVHFAATQATEGTPVALADLQPGDLVFFESPIGHVAMYVGNGLLIEAPHSGDVVRLTRLDDSWHVAEYQTAVRPG